MNGILVVTDDMTDDLAAWADTKASNFLMHSSTVESGMVATGCMTDGPTARGDVQVGDCSRDCSTGGNPVGGDFMWGDSTVEGNSRGNDAVNKSCEKTVKHTTEVEVGAAVRHITKVRDVVTSKDIRRQEGDATLNDCLTDEIIPPADTDPGNKSARVDRHMTGSGKVGGMIPEKDMADARDTTV